jgi:hypothetical protein
MTLVDLEQIEPEHLLLLCCLYRAQYPSHFDKASAYIIALFILTCISFHRMDMGCMDMLFFMCCFNKLSFWPCIKYVYYKF